MLANRCEPAQLNVAKRLAGPGRTFFDVGAQAGMYTLLFARAGAQMAYAFEPLPRNIAVLHRVLALNRISNARIIPCALAADTGPQRFRAAESASEGRLDPDGEVHVLALSCDAFCESYGVTPDVMKIDVEGAELSVLEGAQQVLLAAHPAILLSTHGDELKAACFRLLADSGYARFDAIDHASASEATEFLIA